MSRLSLQSEAESETLSTPQTHTQVQQQQQQQVFDFEDDERFSAQQHMIAGAAAGMTEHMLMFPIDTVKTRMQSYSGACGPTPSVISTMRSIARFEGIRSLWRGVGAVAISAGPAHALHFGVYESAKHKLFPFAERCNAPDATVHAAAGALATLGSESLMAPLDVVKQRMQLNTLSPKQTSSLGVFSYIRYVYKHFGITAFFAGLSSSLVMSVPFSTTQFVVYEASKSTILHLRETLNPSNAESFSATHHCIAGALAGACASAITNPLDVVKTRLQTQGERGARRYRGMIHAMKHIWYEEGSMGFLRGLQARIFFHAPAAAICWTTYEMSKVLLGISSENEEL